MRRKTTICKCAVCAFGSWEFSSKQYEGNRDLLLLVFCLIISQNQLLMAFTGSNMFSPIPLFDQRLIICRPISYLAPIINVWVGLLLQISSVSKSIAGIPCNLRTLAEETYRKFCYMALHKTSQQEKCNVLFIDL